MLDMLCHKKQCSFFGENWWYHYVELQTELLDKGLTFSPKVFFVCISSL